MRAKLPHGQGLWPAFWLRHKAGSSTAEVDIMEYFHATRPGQTSQTVHLPAEIGSNVAKVNTFFETPTATPGWHTWAVEILALDASKQKAKIVFYQDGIKRHEYTPAKFGWLNNYDKTAMFDIAVNLAVGGTHAGHPDDTLAYSRYTQLCLKPARGAPPCNNAGVLRASFPATYEVDYIRVYALEDKPAPVPPVSSTEPSPQPPAANKPSSPTAQAPAGSKKSSSAASRPSSDSIASKRKQKASTDSSESNSTDGSAAVDEELAAPKASTSDTDTQKPSKSYSTAIIYGVTGIVILSGIGAVVIARRAKLF